MTRRTSTSQPRFLPPLDDRPSRHQPGTTRSRFHANCCPPENLLATTAGKLPSDLVLPRQVNKAKIMRSCSHDCIERSALGPKAVTEFLQEHSEFLEEYVMNNVEPELLERWIIRKSQRSFKRAQSAEANGKQGRKTSLSRWKFCVHADKRKMLQELTTSLYLRPNKVHVLSELSATIASAVNAHLWNLFLYDRNTQELYNYGQGNSKNGTDDDIQETTIESELSLASYVARTREAVRFKTSEKDPRFPDGVSASPELAKVVLCHPIVQPDGVLSGVLELYRMEGPEFYEEDEEVRSWTGQCVLCGKIV